MIRVRIAPSPTGFPHIGTIWQALINYAYAKRHKGRFIIRIEDTDRKRFVKGAEKALFEALDWFGLTPDESPLQGGSYGPYRQSERLDIYKKYAEELVRKDCAYYCFCSPERLAKIKKERQKNKKPPMYDQHCRRLSSKEIKKKLSVKERFVIRMKIPLNIEIGVEDFLRGKVTFDSNTIDDQVLIKSDGFPTYHLAVVIDDHLMEISHAVRGEEWLSSAPKHILLYQYFGWKPPVFVHTPTIRNTDGSKLSKRQGHANVIWYQKEGYLPETLLNFLALLGWSHPEEKDLFSLEEFISLFSFERLSKSGPIFDFNKLNWLNGVWIRKRPARKLAKDLKPFLPKNWRDETLLNKIVPLIKERIKTLKEARELIDYFFEEVKPRLRVVIQKDKNKRETKELLLIVNRQLLIVNEKNWYAESLEKTCRQLIEKTGWSARDFFMTLRGAITEKTVTPPLLESMAILGKEKTLKRLQKVIKILK